MYVVSKIIAIYDDNRPNDTISMGIVGELSHDDSSLGEQDVCLSLTRSDAQHLIDRLTVSLASN